MKSPWIWKANSPINYPQSLIYLTWKDPIQYYKVLNNLTSFELTHIYELHYILLTVFCFYYRYTCMLFFMLETNKWNEIKYWNTWNFVHDNTNLLLVNGGQLPCNVRDNTNLLIVNRDQLLCSVCKLENIKQHFSSFP